MDDERDLVTIPRKDRIWHCSGFLPGTGEWCYFVLFPGGFGWHPSVFVNDVILPLEYHLIPLTGVREVAFKPARGWRLGLTSLQITWHAENGETRVFEVEVPFPHFWLRRLNQLSVPVTGAELVDCRTLRGFLSNYGWMVWFGLGFCAGLATFLVSDLGNAMLALAIFLVLTTFGVAFLTWRRS